MISSKKVFCSHRAVDRPRVKEFAAKLLARGIDAWYDEWNVEPGDNDVVTRLNEGLDECDAALLFFSKSQWPATWFDEQVATVVHDRMQRGSRVIPVIIDEEAVLPPPLRTSARRGIEEFDEIVNAITGAEHRSQAENQ